MICFLLLSLWNELSQQPHIYMLRLKSALRKAQLPWALRWFADGRNGVGDCAGPAPPAAVGASQDDTESLVESMWLLSKERVFKGMLISRQHSASSARMAEQPLQLGPQGTCAYGSERRVKAHQVWPRGQQRWKFSTEIHSRLTEGEGKKWLRLEVEKISQELQSTWQEDEKDKWQVQRRGCKNSVEKQLNCALWNVMLAGNIPALAIKWKFLLYKTRQSPTPRNMLLTRENKSTAMLRTHKKA